MELICPPGTQLSAYIRSTGHSLPTPCGGRGNCGKCRVKLIDGELKISTMDRIQLTEDELSIGISNRTNSG